MSPDEKPVLWVSEYGGQSWQTISNYRSSQIVPHAHLDDAEASRTKAALDAFRSDDVIFLKRRKGIRARGVSNRQELTGFLPFDISGGYSISMLAAAIRAARLREWDADRRKIILFRTGWPGTSQDKFLPEGSGYAYGGKTVGASLVDGESEFLWARDIKARAVVEELARSIEGCEIVWDHLGFLQGQGPRQREGARSAFVTKFRDQQDALGLKTRDEKRHIFWDQGTATAVHDCNSPATQEQLEFCQENASGFDWMWGPRFPHYVRDRRHHDAIGALEIAERIGLAQAAVDHHGEWQPLWIDATNISVTGATVTIRLDTPRFSDGVLTVDTDHIEEAQAFGLSLRRMADDAPIAIDSVSFPEPDTIAVAASETLEGTGAVEFGYAGRGVAQSPVPTAKVPGHVGCWGNIRMSGTLDGVIRPGKVHPWLCSFRKTLEL